MSNDETTPAYRAQTGPDHYLAAEEWLRHAEQAWASDEEPGAAQAAAAIAQGHAMLAQAAAPAAYTAGVLLDEVSDFAQDVEGDEAEAELERRAKAAIVQRDSAALSWFDAGVVR